MYCLNATQWHSRAVVQTWYLKLINPHVILSPNLFHDTWIMVILAASPLLMPVMQNWEGVNMVHSQVQYTFLLKHYFTSKLYAAIHEAFKAFSKAFPDKQQNKTTIYWLVTISQHRKCLWQVLIKWKNRWNFRYTDFKECISCNTGICIQKSSTATGFTTSCMKGFMCSSSSCVLNGTPISDLSYVVPSTYLISSKVSLPTRFSCTFRSIT